MMTLFGDPQVWLPFTFATLMGIAILVYVVLDGFDLGVGVLFPFADDREKDRMIASIGPFWDANETWFVLAIGLLLVAFLPPTHNPDRAFHSLVAAMLIGLILRGVAFEYRVKAPPKWKSTWNWIFWGAPCWQPFHKASCWACISWAWSGRSGPWASRCSHRCSSRLVTAYRRLGSSSRQTACSRKSGVLARGGIWGLVLGLGAISLASLPISARIFDKWFSMPQVLMLAPLPLLSLGLLAIIWVTLRRLPSANDSRAWVPFACGTGLFILAFCGMAYSFYPYVVPEKLTLYEAASAPEALIIILAGTVFVLPMIALYTTATSSVARRQSCPTNSASATPLSGRTSARLFATAKAMRGLFWRRGPPPTGAKPGPRRPARAHLPVTPHHTAPCLTHGQLFPHGARRRPMPPCPAETRKTDDQDYHLCLRRIRNPVRCGRSRARGRRRTRTGGAGGRMASAGRGMAPQAAPHLAARHHRRAYGFRSVTCDGLDFALEVTGLQGDAELRDRLLQLYRELSAYDEVPEMLSRLKAAGFATAILSNGAPGMLMDAVVSAGINDRLDAVLSVEEVGIFKPAPQVYDMVGARFACGPEQVLFVSSNGWDVAGAAQYGFNTVWVNRAGDPIDRLPGQPQHILRDLTTIPDLAGVQHDPFQRLRRHADCPSRHR